MPRSYIASKPAPNPQLSGFSPGLEAILLPSQWIQAKLPLWPELTARTSRLSFIDPSPSYPRQVISLPLRETWITNKASPLSSRSTRIALAHLSLFKTIFKFLWRSSLRFWEEAPKDTALAVFPNMAPIPYGAVIPDGVTPGDEFIEVFQAMSTEHGEWAKLITEQIEQSDCNCSFH